MFGRKEPPPSEEHFRKWTEIRSRGEARFVLTRVLIAAGCGIAGAFLIRVWEHKRIDDLWGLVLGDGVGWLIAGFFEGVREWGSNEKRYQREMMMQFSSSNYESPEQTLKQLQRGIENGR
jgi:hypothetical protein